jgi:hypothetical protein
LQRGGGEVGGKPTGPARLTRLVVPERLTKL